MSTDPTPSGFDRAYSVDATHPDCLLTVGFDQDATSIPRFLVRLHHATAYAPLRWTEIARFDHNDDPDQGHDLYSEGLHVDARLPSGGWTKLHPRHGPLPSNRGVLIRACVDYLNQHAQYFVDVFEGTVSPSGPPGWPDGGDPERPGASPDTLFPVRPLPEDSIMSDAGKTADDALSREELAEVLAEATGTSAEDLEREAEAVDIGPPDEADVVEE